MTTLVWLFFTLSCFASAYVTFKITKWYYCRQIKKIKKCPSAR